MMHEALKCSGNEEATKSYKDAEDDDDLLPQRADSYRNRSNQWYAA